MTLQIHPGRPTSAIHVPDPLGLRLVLHFNAIDLIVLVTPGCRTVATWWIGETFLGRCLGGWS